MNWTFLSFLGEPWFVAPWYALGMLGVAYVIHDMRSKNTVLKAAMQWAWPIIVFFFSVIGLALYFATARAPRIGQLREQEAKLRAHHEYEDATWRRVNGAVIHCVAGDGLGIMTAMVIARAGGLSFWQEFWFEYAVGFAIGWFVYQRKSMTMMTSSLARQLAMAFRGEFFSMLTVMGGMGAVMAFVTPMVVTSQPKPLTSSFWGFGMLGLLVGYLFTLPMNWWMVKIGWKHGMGGMEGAERKQVRSRPKRVGIIAGMVATGCASLFLVAWLAHVRESTPLRRHQATLDPALEAQPGAALSRGVRESLQRATEGLAQGDRTTAAVAMDAALRAAQAGAHSAPGAFYSALEQIGDARLSLQQGSDRQASRHLVAAASVLQPASEARPPLLEVRRYRGARVIDPRGAVIGRVTRASGDSLELALGGWQRAWGFVDLSVARRVTVPAAAVAFGPPDLVGMRLVALPTVQRAVASR